MKNLLLKFIGLSLFCLSSEAADFSILKRIVQGAPQYTRQLSTARVIPAPVLSAPKKFIDATPPFDWPIEQRKSLSDFLDNNPQYLKNLPKEIKIVEVGPRDGLQNEKPVLSYEKRAELILRLQNAGLKTIEAGSFVNPKLIPQMQDSEKVYDELMKIRVCYPSDATYPILVPNEKMMPRAIAAQVEDISVFTAASEAFTWRNIQRTIDESLQNIKKVINIAQPHQIRVRAYVSCINGYLNKGDVSKEKVADVTKKLLKMGCKEVSLGDTIGVGTPEKTNELFDYLINEEKIPANKLAAHFHDTNGFALHNIIVALHYGISVVDSSIHGLGGCPYAKSEDGKLAPGNVATEKVVFLCDYLGIKTGVDLKTLIKIKPWIAQELRNKMSKL